MEKQGKIVIVEGNIAAGKTTLALTLGKRLGYRVFLEPTVTNPYLELFYQDPVKYALPMQMWLIKQRFQTYITALKHAEETGEGAILDRSVFGDIVFAQKNTIDGNITQDGYKQYLDLRDELLADLPAPDVTVFLDVGAQTCYERIHNLRKRECESGIPLEYLKGLDACYRLFVDRMEGTGSNVIRVDWSQFGEPDAIVAGVRETALTSLSPTRVAV